MLSKNVFGDENNWWECTTGGLMLFKFCFEQGFVILLDLNTNEGGDFGK
jgi:hypothetical protein